MPAGWGSRSVWKTMAASLLPPLRPSQLQSKPSLPGRGSTPIQASCRETAMRNSKTTALRASIHFKTTVTDDSGNHIPADWPRLLASIAKSGYRGFVGLEYESDRAAAEVPGLCAKLRSLVSSAA